ncbi:hypothetical protein [Aquihabitans sp. McL0605]|uniref:hypothetical protein n=1 Tax=Aquihabitans sp. McL0605 TaxID=3415671 RepID=UPI003CF7295B
MPVAPARRAPRTERSGARRTAGVGVAIAVALVLLAACDVPVSPAGKVFDAWKADNPAAATSTMITSSAKTQLFSQPYTTTAKWGFITCQGTAGTTYCTWVNKLEGRLILGVTSQTHKVSSVQRISLGSNEAGRTFHAWRTGSLSSVAAYATPAARAELAGLTYKPADHWLPDGCQGAAGSLFCTWYREDGASLTLQVDNVSSPKQVIDVTGTIFGP